jgi:succinate dehydrogenase flavin-adding protein (antitoxin of CptAB toxin-antitoxin module)
MSLPALQAFSEVLDVDNPDLFKWLTGQLPADAGIAQNPSFQVRRWPIVSSFVLRMVYSTWMAVT